MSAAVIAAMACGGSPAPAPAAPASDDQTELGEDRPESRRASAPELDDDDDDDGVEIAGLRGRLDRYAIEKGIEPHRDALTRCYTDKLGRQRYIGGEVEFAFVVARDGSVAKVRLSRSDLGAWPMEKCLLATARKMQFSSPEGGGEADFTLPLSFTPRRQPALWDGDRAQTEVSEYTAALATCGEAEGATAPQSVVVTAYVGARGEVMSAGFAADTAPVDDVWADCAAGVVEGWVLSDPRGRVAKLSFRYTPE